MQYYIKVKSSVLIKHILNHETFNPDYVMWQNVLFSRVNIPPSRMLGYILY